MIVYLEFIATGAMQISFMTILNKPCVKVARHSVVTKRIGTIGGNVDIENPIVLNLILFSGWNPRLCIIGQNNYSVVRCAYSDFIFGANHSAAIYTLQFALLNDECLVAFV